MLPFGRLIDGNYVASFVRNTYKWKIFKGLHFSSLCTLSGRCSIEFQVPPEQRAILCDSYFSPSLSDVRSEGVSETGGGGEQQGDFLSVYQKSEEAQGHWQSTHTELEVLVRPTSGTSTSFSKLKTVWIYTVFIYYTSLSGCKTAFFNIKFNLKKLQSSNTPS